MMYLIKCIFIIRIRKNTFNKIIYFFLTKLPDLQQKHELNN
jgi:hypothetical protein